MGFFSHIFRDAFKGKFGKRKVIFPQKSLAHPTIIEQRVAAKSTTGFGAKSFLSAHPDFSGAKLVDQERDQGDAIDTVEALSFETLPGLSLVTFKNEKGSPGSVTHSEQRVATGTSADGFSYGTNLADVQAIDGAVSLKITETQTNPRIYGSFVSEASLGDIGVLETQIVAAGSSPQSGFLIIDSTDEPMDEAHTKETTRSVSSWATLTSREGITANRLLLRHISATAKTTVVDRVSPDTIPTRSFLTVESDVKAENKDRSILSVTSVEAFDVLISGDKMDHAAQGEATQTTETIVTPDADLPLVDFRTLDCKQESIDSLHSLQVVKVLGTGAFPIITSYEVDPETRKNITVTHQIINAATVTAPTQVAGTEIKIEGIDKWRSLKITRTIDSSVTSLARNERHSTEYTFSDYIAGVSTLPVTDANGNSRLLINWNRKGGKRRNVTIRVHITYHTSEPGSPPSGSSLFSPKYNDLVYNGVFFNVNERNVLNDGNSIGITVAANTAWPGGVVETYTYGASSPSASDYVGLIGTEQLIFWRSLIWRMGIWRAEEYFLVMQ